MGEQNEGRGRPQGVRAGGGDAQLILGSGWRARELGALAAALRAVREGGSFAGQAPRTEASRAPGLPAGGPPEPSWESLWAHASASAGRVLGDVEELLITGREAGSIPSSGVLVLETDSVPAEDIGFVRRFLQKRPGWTMYVVGEDPRSPEARALLGLRGARWSGWPPRYEEIAALAGALGAPSPAPGSPNSASAPPPARSARSGGSGGSERPGGSRRPGPESAERTSGREGSPPAGPSVLVVPLVEEAIAGASLEGDGPRFELRRPDSRPTVALEPGELRRGLLGLLELARGCAGPGGTVAVAIGEPAHGPDGACEIRVDFPPGPITDGDLPGLLETPFEAEKTLAPAVDAARQGAALLRELGVSVDLLPVPPASLRIVVGLPDSRSGAPGPGGAGSGAHGGARGRAQAAPSS